jgi:mono/diheme cytochrome c family protein
MRGPGRLTAIGGVLVAILLAPLQGTAADLYSADAFATCSACHLPDGAGVPGAFPPIRNRAAKIAGLAGGREYLITVVSFGLMGTIEVEGMTYYGVMAGNAGPLQPDDIAAALNYLVFELGREAAADVEPFTAEEVAAVQAAVKLKSPAGGGELRNKLRDEHGGQWP